MILEEGAHIEHYGTPRHSGRYPWGSGGNATVESKRNRDFLDSVAMLRKDGLSDTDIAKGMGITTQQFRARNAIATNQQRQERINQAQRLKDDGWGDSAIGRRMGINESTVRGLLAPGAADRAAVLTATADALQKAVDANPNEFIDIGKGVENQLGITRTKLNNAIAIAQENGYEVHTVPVPQLGRDQDTNTKVLAAPGTTWADVARNKGNIKQLQTWSEDAGRTHLVPQDPLTISSKRVGIRYRDEGGLENDGVVFIRPGVKDISIGENHYAQVRVSVDGTHYIKGMAVYKDDLPPGVDLLFNTNKPSTTPKMEVLKPLTTRKDGTPDTSITGFGSAIRRQIIEMDGGKERVTSAMNLVNEEGSWSNWSKALSSQILSKQHTSLVKSQLDVTFENKNKTYNEILSLTNPTVRKRLLEDFSDEVDASAVHLKAAALPGSAYHALLPVSSMKRTEVYAPNYQNGSRVALIRSPHGGPFEIPNLVVNNRNREAASLMGKQARDAIGIHPSVAEKLSGADFDGDAVLVIPNDKGMIKHAPSLEGLRGFDPKASFPKYPGMKKLEGAAQQKEMGRVTNLIADMSIQGASGDEIARAVRHSMVVIDAEKHELDHKGSYRQNGIAELKERYQGSKRGGAKTIVTRAGAETWIDKRKPRPAEEGGPIDKETGKKVFVPSGKMKPETKLERDPVTGKKVYVKTGRMVPKQEKVDRLSIEDDAFKLSSGQPVEVLYATHSNQLKALANSARREMVNTKPIPYDKSAKAAYSKEVASLNAQLNIAKKNSPRERQAQVLAGTLVSQKRQENPEMDKSVRKKVEKQALDEARARMGAHKTLVQISDSEWDAIQAGAISASKLNEILNHADMESVKKHAMPKDEILMTATKRNRALSMANSGYTQAEIARALGVSLTTLKTSING